VASDLADVEFVVRVIAQTAVDNEEAFCQLDSVVGDGDFGYSLARGFEIILAEWETLDRSSPGSFLQKVAMIITGRVGGTSGPIWGTAFLRAAMAVRNHDSVDGPAVVDMLDQAIAGIKTRGGAEVGEKTLLDSLVPLRDTVARLVAEGASSQTVIDTAAATARTAGEETSALQARRGRASYTGERSIGSPDAGAIAIAVMAERIAKLWPERVTDRAS